MKNIQSIAQTLVNNEALKNYFSEFSFSKETLQVPNKELTDKQKNFFMTPIDLLEVKSNLSASISKESDKDLLEELKERLQECETLIEKHLVTFKLNDDITLFIQSYDNRSRNIISQSKNYDLNSYKFNSLAWLEYDSIKVPFGFGQGFSSLLFLGTRPKENSLIYGIINEIVTYVNNELKPNSKSNSPKISELKNELLLAKLTNEYISMLLKDNKIDELMKFNTLQDDDKAEILLAYNESK